MAFKSLEKPLLDGKIYLDSDYFDTKSVMLYVTIAGTVVSILMCFVLIIKLRQMAAALIILQRVVSVKSLDTKVPSFIYENLDKKIETDTAYDLAYHTYNITLLSALLNNPFVLMY